jgi:hypothetical protein
MTVHLQSGHSALPRPTRAEIWLVRAFAATSAVGLAILLWREGEVHSFIWLTHGGFALASLVCAEALARRVRWAWWVLLLLFGRRALIYASAVFGAYQQAESGTAMQHLRLVGTLGAWLLFFVVVVGLLLHHENRAAFRTRAG